MTIIFLDIDGVLNIFDSSANEWPDFGRITRFETKLRSASITLVNKLAEKHDALIVISSTWRLHDKQFHQNKPDADFDNLNFDLRGFLGKSGLTAKFHDDWYTPYPRRLSWLLEGRPRGCEIREWVNAHPEVTSWVAIDDDASGFTIDEDIVTSPRHRLARTNPMKGFNQETFEAADGILQNIS